jgi:hypothetical protein
MLVLAILFGLWAALRPLVVPTTAKPGQDRTTRD